jgi:hypothetical protein
LGLALQWKCLLAVLPVVAAVQRALLYKLGLGRADAIFQSPAAAAGGSARLDASYRKPAPAGVSTSLDSGVNVVSSEQAKIEAAAMSVIAGSMPTAGTQADVLAYSLTEIAAKVEPCGRSFMSFLHTTAMPPSGLWRLLQVAPLIASLLWGALFWAAAQAVRWGVWAFRAWGWAQSGV